MTLSVGAAKNEKEYNSKVVIIGENENGKSSLFNSLFSTKSYTDNYTPSYGASYIESATEHEGISIKLCCFDTPGAQHFEFMTKSLCRGAKVILFCVDLSAESLDENKLDEQLNRIKENVQTDNYKLIVVGTKSDIAKEENITAIQEWMKKNELGDLIQTSAKENTNVNDLNAEIVKAAYTTLNIREHFETNSESPITAPPLVYENNNSTASSSSFFKSCPVNYKWLSGGASLAGTGLIAAGIATMVTIAVSPWFALLVVGCALLTVGIGLAVKAYLDSYKESEPSVEGATLT